MQEWGEMGFGKVRVRGKSKEGDKGNTRQLITKLAMASSTRLVAQATGT